MLTDSADFSFLFNTGKAVKCLPIGSEVTLEGIDNNVDLACTGLSHAAPSSILAGPVACVCLQKLHKQQ